jgi:hypothetical protein
MLLDMSNGMDNDIGRCRQNILVDERPFISCHHRKPA